MSKPKKLKRPQPIPGTTSLTTIGDIHPCVLHDKMIEWREYAIAVESAALAAVAEMREQAARYVELSLLTESTVSLASGIRNLPLPEPKS